MHFQFATYRWGDDLVGGAELHHRRLATELADLGHEVSVLTTDGAGIRPFCHWGVVWETLNKRDSRAEPGIPVRRFPLKKRSAWRLAFEAKRLQFRIETEEAEIADDLLGELLAPVDSGVRLLNGWHYPETQNGAAVRWSHGTGRFATRGDASSPGVVQVRGNSPKPNRIRLLRGKSLLGDKAVGAGWFDVEFEFPGGGEVYSLVCGGTWRPLRDFRELGVQVHGIDVVNERGRFAADMWEDFRALGRLSPSRWQRFLLEHCEARPAKFGAMIDRLRGPESTGLRNAIKTSKADVVIHCNMPWANMSFVRPGDLAMPLWHMEDEFYYWQHWIAGLRRARFVLANTPYAAQSFYPGLGIAAHFVGPPIWEPVIASDAGAVARFRAQAGAASDDVLVLTVCRKSGEKRYDAIATAVADLRAAGTPIRMAGVGPDADGRPFEYDGCRWLGKLEEAELSAAYAGCDMFALMSESESFGMVIPEAWHHGKPVVVNRACGPAASLVESGADGLLALPGRELAEALKSLADSAPLRRRLGEAGRAKAGRLYVRGAAARRLLTALESAPARES